MSAGLLREGTNEGVSLIRVTNALDFCQFPFIFNGTGAGDSWAIDPDIERGASAPRFIWCKRSSARCATLCC